MSAKKITGTGHERLRVDPSSVGICPERLDRLFKRIEADVAARQYPGCGIAMARHGKLVVDEAFGFSRIERVGNQPVLADRDTLWLLYSQTKPITSSAIWLLAERGLLNFHESIATYIPQFARHGKDKVTLHHVLTHQAGFPNAVVPHEIWIDRSALRETICNFELEWQPGSRVCYHPSTAHWVQAVLIELVTGIDYRRFIHKEILEPIGLNDTFIGVPSALHHRVTENYDRTADGEHVVAQEFNTPGFLSAGIPQAGGFATPSNIVLFYQMLLGLGSLSGVRVLAPRTVQYAVRNHTEERIDEFFGIPMHRGLGVHVRGETKLIRGMGSTASPRTFGHGGMGTSYAWADPETGVSFAYFTNSRLPDAAHGQRLEAIMSMAHATIVDL